MRRLKNYALLLSTLFFILLGAVMPRLASRMQDAQLSGLQKKLELSAVDLTLRQEDDVGRVLQLISKEHTESLWEGKTTLDRAEARQAAMAVLETMDQYGLLPEGDLKRFLKAGQNVEPQLLVGEDDSFTLIWACTWTGASGTLITLDDATGKAVRILAELDPADSGTAAGTGNPADSGTAASTRALLEQWIIFLQDYYDITLVDIREKIYLPDGARFTFTSEKDGAAFCDLNLEITDDLILFNYQ